MIIICVSSSVGQDAHPEALMGVRVGLGFAFDMNANHRLVPICDVEPRKEPTRIYWSQQTEKVEGSQGCCLPELSTAN